ncbi:MAG: nitronate monooxygenase, partial [Thermomicrobiales bacterium]
MSHAAIDTPFTRMLGLRVPVAQAPVGGASTPELAAAVANAGGLGVLSITWRDPQVLPGMLTRTLEMASGPVAVNLVLEWDPEERLRIALDAGVRLVSFFWGDPAPWMEPIKAAGGRVIHTVGSAEEARLAVAAGVDLIVAQGVEAGGHVWSGVSTMSLIPRVADAVGGAVPVLAAGGIMDGRGIAAALALGADGVWMGTRFLMASECAAHPLWQERLIAA